MRGRAWLKCFIDSVRENEEKYYPGDEDNSSEWTKFMGRVLDGVGVRLNCRVARLRGENKDKSKELNKEYLNIDAMFFDSAHYDLEEDQDRRHRLHRFGLPKAAVELENWPDPAKISFCLWKLMCIGTPVRVLICYQQSREDVDSLVERLRNDIRQESLMKETGGDLLIIIGNDDHGQGKESPWEDYFRVFEWRSNGLQEIRGIKWTE